MPEDVNDMHSMRDPVRSSRGRRDSITSVSSFYSDVEMAQDEVCGCKSAGRVTKLADRASDFCRSNVGESCYEYGFFPASATAADRLCDKLVFLSRRR